MRILTSKNPAIEAPIEAYEIRQAMVALELGPADKSILDYLETFCDEVPIAAIYFLHVLPQITLYNEEESLPLISEARHQGVVARLQKEVQERMEKRDAIHMAFDVREGDPLEELLADAGDVDADLTVIGQRHGTEHHGILARNLARKLKGNALVIPQMSRPGISHILVPIDFSIPSVMALRQAIALRLRLGEGVRVSCLHIYEQPDLQSYRLKQGKEDLEKLIREDRELAFRIFMQTYAKTHNDLLRVEALPQEGPGIAENLLHFARREEVDFIVMGATGHSRVEQLLLGSVTEQVLNKSTHIPVLIIKPE